MFLVQGFLGKARDEKRPYDMLIQPGLMAICVADMSFNFPGSILARPPDTAFETAALHLTLRP